MFEYHLYKKKWLRRDNIFILNTFLTRNSIGSPKLGPKV